MVKISRTRHVTRRGVIKRNPIRSGWFVKVQYEYGRGRPTVEGPFGTKAQANAWLRSYMKDKNWRAYDVADVYQSLYVAK